MTSPSPSYHLCIDVREAQLIEKTKALATPSAKEHLPAPIAVETSALLIGDVVFQRRESGSVKDILLFERKTFADLLASIKDGRYDEQSHRILHTSGLLPHHVVYVLEGSLATLRNPADKRVIQSAMTSLMYFKGFSVIRTANTQETADVVWAMCTKLQKEFSKGRPVVASYGLCGGGVEAPRQVDEPGVADAATATAATQEPVPAVVPYSTFVKKAKQENITPENIGEIILCQIPGISSTSAGELMRQYGGSLYGLLEDINERPEKLHEIHLTSAGGKRRKLGSNIVHNLQKYLRKPTTAVAAVADEDDDDPHGEVDVEADVEEESDARKDT